MALLWTRSTSRDVVGLLDALQLRSEATGKPFTQERVKALRLELLQSGQAREKEGAPGYYVLTDPFRAQVYAELLDHFALADLRHALHQQVGLKVQVSVYATYWNLGESGANAAVFRLELFSGADEAEVDLLRHRIASRVDWSAVYGQACFEGFDANLIERIPATWRWDISFQATYALCARWHPQYHPIARWALEQSRTRRSEMPLQLLHQLAEWQLHCGQEALVRDLLQGDTSGQADALCAALLVQQGQWVDAAAAFEVALKKHQLEVGAKKRVFNASLAWYYPLALLAQQTPRAVEAARKFCIGESGKKAPKPDEGWGMWVHAASVRLGDVAPQPDAFEISSAQVGYTPLESVWRLLLRAWLLAEMPMPSDNQRQSKLLAELLEVLRMRLESCDLHWIGQQIDIAHAMLTSTDAVTPSVAFFASSGTEAWRGVLASLQALGDAGDSGDGRGQGADTQLWWLLTLGKQGNVVDIKPLERKRGVRGWGMPKAINPGKLFGKTDLAPHDAKVARAIRHERFDRRSFQIDRAAAVMALIGHPFVALAESPETLVDVVEGVPQIESVHEHTAQGERIVLRVSPEPHTEQSVSELWHYCSDEIERKELETLRYVSVLRDSAQRVRVIRLTPAQRRAAQLVSGRFSVPASAQADLQAALGALAGHFNVHSDEAAAAVRQVPSDPMLRAELSPAGDGLMLRLVVAPLGPQGPRLMPGRGRARVMAAIGGESVGAERDLATEQVHLDNVLATLTFIDPPGLADTACEWVVEEPDLALSMVEQLPGLAGVAAIDWPRGKAVRVSSLDSKKVQISVRSERDWFRVEGSATLDEGRVLSLQVLLAAAAASTRFVALGEGAYLALSKALRDKLQALAAVLESDKNGLRAPQMAAQWLDLALEDVISEFDAKFKQRIERLRKAQSSVTAMPNGLQAELRAYQEDGYVWAMRLAQAGFGACLADDMGLGKTLQSLAVLLARSAGGAALVVAPTSVCGNWMAEAQRFAPGLNFMLYGESEREKLITAAGAGDVLVVSYSLMQQAAEAFAARSWHTLIADESQAVKNALAKRSQALFDIAADFRLALSGTPVENRLADLWSVMRFCNPGLLGTLSRFNERFVTPIERNRDRDAQRLLRRLIAPFVLRRTKSQVLDDLPPRTELIFSVVPDADEAAHYEALRRTAVSAAQAASDDDGAQAGQARMHILAQLTRLRRAACDPRLTTPDLGYVGAKVRAFAELASELRANGHKALVFSQFVDFLTLLRVPLDEAGIAYQYLDGATPAAERTRRVAAFQAGAGDLFLISLKAGGFGLNLTAADYVVITDPWWNPAAEDQAMGRAHRIGQLRPVTVYRLVSKGTLEERIIELHHDKRALAEGILAEGGEAASLPSSAELIDLMRG